MSASTSGDEPLESLIAEIQAAWQRMNLTAGSEGQAAFRDWGDKLDECWPVLYDALQRVQVRDELLYATKALLDKTDQLREDVDEALDERDAKIAESSQTIEEQRQRIERMHAAITALCEAIEKGHAVYDGKERHPLAVVNHARAILGSRP